MELLSIYTRVRAEFDLPAAEWMLQSGTWQE